jgi:hypothetical protein
MNVRQALAKLFRTDGARTVRRPRPTRPTLELLEARCVPTNNNSWIGPAGGLWSTGANWSLGRPPISDDWISFDQANTSSEDDIPNLTVQNISTPSNFTGTITIDGGNNLTSTTDFVAYGGLVLGDSSGGGSTLTVDGTFYQNGSLFTGGGNSSITAGQMIQSAEGSLTVTGGSGNPTLGISTSLLQGGTITVSNSALYLSGSYNQLAGGTDILTRSNLFYVGSAMDVSGIVDMIDGAEIASLRGFTLHGTLNTINDLGGANSVDVIIGSLTNSGGTINWVGGLHGLQVTGDYHQSLGTLSMRIALPGNSDVFTINGTASLGGTLNVTGDVTAMSSSWTLLSGGGYTNGFEHVNLPPPASGPGWTYSWGSSGGSYSFMISD